MMKRKFSLLLVLVLLFCAFPVTASANSPPPFPWYWFELTNLPEGTVYVDMLVKLPEEDSHYTSLVTENLPDGFSPDAPIVNYCQKNFQSYTFHYKNAKSMIKVGSDNAVYFFTDAPQNHPIWEHNEDIYERGRIRLAMLDENGNILQVSRTLSIKSKSLFDYQLNTFHYDAQADSLEADRRFNMGGMLLFLFLSAVGLVLTCLLEDWMAVPFKLWKQYNELIFKTNLISQVLMRLLHVLLYGWVFAHYAWTVVFMEILVYFGEFLIYRKKMKEISLARVLWYTVAANTISLVIGIIPMMIV